MLRRPIPYWLLYIIAVVVLSGASYFINQDLGASISIQIDKPSEAFLDVVKSMITLITTLNTTMMAGATALVVRGHDWTDRWTKVDGGCLLISYLAGATSYYGVYVAYVALLELIDQKVLSATSPRLLGGLTIQFYGTIIGFLFLGFVFARMLEGRRPKLPHPAAITERPVAAEAAISI